MLHVLNGDSTRYGMEESGLPGECLVWADVFHDGPTPLGLNADEFRRVRATYLAGVTQGAATLQQFERRDAALGRYGAHEEVVFWFEHDLYDQLILLRHLHWLSQVDAGETRFSLICIDRFPGLPDFAGLGQLTGAQLATLFPQRRAIGDEQIRAGRAGWIAFCSPQPEPLVDWLRSDTSALPFADGALRRHLQDYPWMGDGLSRSQRQALNAIASGARTFAPLFQACQRMEERIYMGDLSFIQILRDLASGREPLLTLTEDAGDLRRAEIALTAAGDAVRTGAADHVALNGIDRWMGGVHLTTERHWRYETIQP